MKVFARFKVVTRMERSWHNVSDSVITKIWQLQCLGCHWFWQPGAYLGEGIVPRERALCHASFWLCFSVKQNKYCWVTEIYQTILMAVVDNNPLQNLSLRHCSNAPSIVISCRVQQSNTLIAVLPNFFLETSFHLKLLFDITTFPYSTWGLICVLYAPVPHRNQRQIATVITWLYA